MMKMKAPLLGALLAGASLVRAAEPWAVWTDFTGATADTGLAPQISSTQNGIDASAWRLKLGSASAVTGGGSLRTGTGSPSAILFGGETIDVGRASDNGKPMTVLLEIDGPVTLGANKPFVHLGNGSTGVGMAMAAATTVRGTWGNAAWGDPRVTVSAMNQRGTFYVALGTCYDKNNPTAVALIDPSARSVTWNNLADLTGKGVNATQITFGNFVNATSGGLNYTLRSVAVFAGRASNEELLAYVPPVIPKSEGGDWLFEDIADTPRATIQVSGAQSPTSFTVNNSATDYLIQGDAIRGTIPLTKRGTGKLTLCGDNTFSGGVVIEGGTVVESGVKGLNNALGTGKNGSWANKITLKNGTFDVNNTKNYRNASQTDDAYWGWLSVQTMLIGGQADGVMEITGGVFGIGTSPMFTYDATKNPGKATVSAHCVFSGTSSAQTRVFAIGDSEATEVEMEFTGGLHANTWLDGQSTTIEKTGAGTMKISCGFGFKGLKVTGGTVLMGKDYAFLSGTRGKFDTLTLNGGTLDLGSTTQAFAPSAITLSSGNLVATDGGTLELSAGTYAGEIAGTMNVTATGALSLTGNVSTTGTLRVAPGASLTLTAMPENATIEVDCSGLALSEAGTTWVPLIIPGISDTTRVHLVGEGVDLMSGSYDEATGNYTLTVNRAGKPLTWMAWGDSITEGESSAVSYRHALWNKLAAAGYDITAVGLRNATHDQVRTNEPWSWHNAWYGAMVMPIRHGVTSLYLNLDAALEAGGYPDLITVMIGTNDAASYQGARGNQNLDARFDEWRVFIERMAKLRPQSQIIVATPPKLRADRDEADRTLIEGYRQRIVDAQRTGASPFNLPNVSFVDIWANTTLEIADYIADGTHPSASGCEKLADAWFPAIQAVLDTNGVKANLAIAEVFNSDATTLKVRLNKPITLTEGAAATLSGADVTLGSLALSEDGRVVTATASGALPTLTQLTLTLTGAQSVQSANETAPLSATFTALGSGAAANVPEAYRAGFKHRKTVALATDYTSATAVAEEAGADAAETLPAARRVAYYLELQREGCPAQFVWVSMDAFADEEAMGVPTVARGNHQGEVTHLQVYGNRGNFANTSAEATDVRGLIEFTPYTYNGTATATTTTEELYTGVLDWRDTLSTSGNGYGCMQVARITGTGLVGPTWAPAEMLFAFNGFNTTSAADLGIGSFNTNLSATSASASKSYDWTFTTTSGIAGIAPGAYTVRKLEIWVEPGQTLTWAGAAKGEWNTTDGAIWAENTAFTAGDAVTFGALSGEVTEATVSVPAATFSGALTVSQAAYTFSGEETLTAGQLTVADGASADFALPLVASDVAANGAVTASSLTASAATIGANGSLTVKTLSGLGSVPGGSGTFVYDGGETGTLTLGHTSANTPKVTVASGTLVIPTSNSTSASGSFNPVYTVKSGATLRWSGHDLVGWGRTNTVKVAEVSGVLEKTGTAANMNETFSGLLLLKDGGEVRNSGSNDYFMLHKSAVIEVEAGASAKLTGNSFKSNDGTPILRVGEGATLTVQAPINLAAPLKKEGAGLWIQAQNGLTGTSLLTVAEGTLRFERAGGSDLWVEGPITVDAGATLDIRKNLKKSGGAVTLNGTLTGDGTLASTAAGATLTVGASGRIEPIGALTIDLASAATIAPRATIVANGNAITCTNGLTLSGEGTITVAVDAQAAYGAEPSVLISYIGALESTAFTAPSGYTLAKTEAGALTIALAPLPKPERPAEAESDTSVWSDAATREVLALTGGTAPAVIEATSKAGTQLLTAAEASAAMELFRDIATVSESEAGKVLTVAYDFGITAMTPQGTEIEVIAEVRRGADAAEIAEGTTLSLVLADGTPIEGVAFSPVAQPDGSVKYRARVNSALITKPFRVKASAP